MFLSRFDAFIFSHNPKKNELLFENIIDESKVYKFPRPKNYYSSINKISSMTTIPIKVTANVFDQIVTLIICWLFVGRE